MITKRTYRFSLESNMPHYPGDSTNNFRISGFGSIEDYGEKNSLQIELKEEGQRIPMLYQVWLVLGEKDGQIQEINLGDFRSVEEKIIKWQTVFSSQDIGALSCHLEQVNSITIRGIPQDINKYMDEQNIYFISNQLGSPEIEIILEEEELEKILKPFQPEESSTISTTQEIIDNFIIEEELIEDLQSEDRNPEPQEKAEWEKLLEQIPVKETPGKTVQKEEKKIWKLPEPLSKQQLEIESPKFKIIYN